MPPKEFGFGPLRNLKEGHGEISVFDKSSVPRNYKIKCLLYSKEFRYCLKGD